MLAHELAHSWTGNLVTNANAEHFWLNEGFTIFAERRIQEKLEGVEMHALHEALGRRALDAAILSFAQQPGLTRLRTELAGVDPDEAFSVVPYEKGYLFLKTLERHVGRAAFDGFLKRYIDTFRFQSILTDDFLHLLEEVLPGAYAAVDGATWVDGEGVPENAPVAASSRLDALSALGSGVPSVETAAGWSSAEWQLYLDHLNDHSQDAPCAALDAAFHLSDSKSAEILVGWLELCIHAGYAPPLARLDAVLGRIGRMKYLKPLYAALIGRPELRDRARDLFERHGAGYHPIARQVVAGLLGKP